MAIRSESPDEQFVLRQVVSEIRWILAHSGGVRADLIRLVRRYEDALYDTYANGRAGERSVHPPATIARILPFPGSRSSGDPATAPTNGPGDSA